MCNLKIFRQIVVLLPVYLGSIFSGMGYSWVASNMAYLQSTGNLEIPYTIRQITILALLLHIGRIFASFINILALGKLGRKVPLIIANSSFLVSACLVLLSKDYLVVAISRFVNGFATGVSECFNTIYLGEITLKSARGMTSSIGSASFGAGVLLQYALGTYLSYDDGAIFRVILAILVALSTYYSIESPHYLKASNPDEALKTIAWLRAIKLKQAEKEFQDINVIQTDTEFFEFFKNPVIYKSFSMSLSLGFINTALTVVFTAFANFIIPETELLNSHQFAILLNIISTLMNILSAFSIEHTGRRLLLGIGFVLGIFLNAVITVLYYLEEKSITKMENFSWIIFSIIVLFLIIYSLNINPAVGALRTELFPMSHKILGISSTIVFNSIAFAIGSVFFLQIANIYGIYVNFLVYCICCLLGLVIVVRYLPETKGKSLEEIQDMLKNAAKTTPIK